MSAYRVGLTGGLAAGKSTVARWLAEAGFRVVDADRLVAESYRPGGPGVAAVERLFGSVCLDSRGGVDRQRLAAAVFSDPAARRRLEAAIHPLVAERFAELARGHDGVIVLEAALLVEAGMEELFDLLVTVEAEPATRIARAVARGLDPEAARRRIEAQADPDRRRRAADLVLDNDGDLAALRRQVDRLVADLRRERDAV